MAIRPARFEGQGPQPWARGKPAATPQGKSVDGFVPGTTAGGSVCKIGAGDVLTDPAADACRRLEGELFSDGELRISNSGADARGREVLAAGTFCSNARCNAIRCNPWASLNKQVKHVVIEGDAGAGPCANYWFYGCSALERVDGMSALLGVVQMRHTLNSCTALETLDLRGFKPGRSRT